MILGSLSTKFAVILI